MATADPWHRANEIMQEFWKEDPMDHMPRLARASNPTCQFCGGEHPEQELTFLGLTVAIRPCPNMPTAWVAIGPDAEGDLTILDVQTGPLADPRFRDAGPPERFGDE